MPNLLFISDNASFAEDLCGQIKYYAPEFSLVEEKDAGILDIVVLDDKPAPAIPKRRFFCCFRKSMKFLETPIST